jgi:hypothetical protein
MFFITGLGLDDKKLLGLSQLHGSLYQDPLGSLGNILMNVSHKYTQFGLASQVGVGCEYPPSSQDTPSQLSSCHPRSGSKIDGNHKS